MNKVIKPQLEMLRDTLEFQVDGKPTKDFPEYFSSVVFYKSDKDVINTAERRFIFAHCMVKPFEGFTFNDKFNNGICPPSDTMYGRIVRETEKMYYLDTHSYDSKDCWKGWCSKKLVTVEEI